MNNKDLILQYVDTGLSLPEYQVTQLPNWAKKTYIRKRVIATDNSHLLKFYEIKLLGDSEIKKYFETIGSDDLRQLFRREDIRGGMFTKGLDSVINTYINNVDMKGVFHFNSVLEFITDKNKDKFISLYLDNNISNIGGHEISNIIMNSDTPMPFIIRMFTNEHVLSIMKSRLIYYIDSRVGVVNFLNELNDKTVLKLSELFIKKSDEDHVRKVIVNNLFNIDFDDSISGDLISMLLYTHGDVAVKLLNKNLSGSKFITIFSDIEYYVGEDKLGPIGKQLAIKYGSINDPRLY
jgi:DNA-dependent RNA polymerase auxiliary subunit epsilon